MAVTVGEYGVDLLDEIGRGAFGTVVKGKHQYTQEAVAVKKINYGSDKNVNEEMLKMANNELYILRQLKQHVNIVRLLHEEDDGRNKWIIMEFCELGDLSAYLGERKSLDIIAKVKLMTECASALSFMHSFCPPVVHRDIKPSNTLLRRVGGEDVVKIADFGLGKFFESQSLKNHYTMGTLAGSQYFMAPEFFACDRQMLKYQPSVDTFALGLLFQVILLHTENHPQMEPLSVESQGTNITIPVGLGMFSAKTKGTPMPQLFGLNHKNNKAIQQLIIQMTAYEEQERPALSAVDEQLSQIYSQLLRKSSDAVTTRKSYCHVTSGVQIHVSVADITSFQVNAIVCATDIFMKPSGGVSAAIHSKGGTPVDQEASDYIKKNRTLPVGCTCVTTSGKLPCQKVIHTVGPKMKDHTSEELTAVLKGVFDNILEEATKYAMQSIAIPGVSAGLYAVPKTTVANCTCQSIIDFCNEEKSSSLTEVYLVDTNASMASCWREELDKFVKKGLFRGM